MPKARTQAIDFAMYRKFAGLTVAGAVLLAIFAVDNDPAADELGPVISDNDALVVEAPAATPKRSAGAWGKDAAPDEIGAELPRAYSGASQSGDPNYVPEELRGYTPAQRNSISARLEAQSAIRSGSV